jgi:histidinol-phosphatase (PHP family)
MKTNYHTHTKRCLHAFGTEEDYVQAALKEGLSVLGFTDHAPFPDHDFGMRMPYSQLEPYFTEVDRLTKIYAPDIQIKKSLEIEYLPQYRDYYTFLMNTYHPDYLLLGEHFYFDPQGEVLNIYNAESTDDYIHYANSIASGLETGLFQVVAHPDLFTLNKFAWDRNCDAASEIIISAAQKHGAVLEFNANGYRRGIHEYPDGKRHMYPHMNFWKKAAEAGSVVMIGADAHEPYQVWDTCMDQAIEVLCSLGITPLKTLDEVLK